WYLKQNDFEILFPRELITNSNYEDIDYNVLTENDKKMILNLVHAYMNTKYTKIQNKQEFFDKNFDLFIARMSDVELQSFEYKNE
ncbi:TPA: XRE family transcriptional regulator, partial [Staphylococcus aureus]|nr:XRE family transcriptional regulator [Staphylococcus aureus]